MAATSEPDKVDLMRQSCAYARQSIPVETAYCVGCVIVKDGEVRHQIVQLVPDRKFLKNDANTIVCACAWGICSDHLHRVQP
eukprot:SAG11_NODE_919_length_6545_cov_5.571052_1_plen_82_part_00